MDNFLFWFNATGAVYMLVAALGKYAGGTPLWWISALFGILNGAVAILISVMYHRRRRRNHANGSR